MVSVPVGDKNAGLILISRSELTKSSIIKSYQLNTRDPERFIHNLTLNSACCLLLAQKSTKLKYFLSESDCEHNFGGQVANKNYTLITDCTTLT